MRTLVILLLVLSIIGAYFLISEAIIDTTSRVIEKHHRMENLLKENQ